MSDRSTQKKRKKVRDKIKAGPKVYWFLIGKKEAKVLVKGDTEAETKKELKRKVKNGRYDGEVIWRIKIDYYSKVDIGRVSISINNWIVENGKLKKKPHSGKIGVVWIDDHHIDLFGWKKKYIISIIKGLTIHKKKLKSIMPNFYSDFSSY